MRKLLVLTAGAALLATLPAVSDMFHDRLDPTATGGITGRVVGEGLKLTEAVAVEQVAYKFYAGSVAGDTYSFSGLPPGKYDLLLRTDEHVFEGLRLDVWGENEELPKQDKLAIKKLIDISDDFYPNKKIVRAGGTKEQQKLLVEQTRTELTLNPDGSKQEGMLRRIDYTIVRKTRDVWQIAKVRHMLRENPPLGSKAFFHYRPQLGGIRVADDVVAIEDVRLNDNIEE